jgi:RNA polymerase sigma-70 factor (ECF subfamily)
VTREPGPSETDLWERSLSGDGEAFGMIFDLHRDRVYRHARRLMDTTEDGEDVAAAAFLELWRRRASVRLVRGSVLPWLLVTTSNVARNAARARRRYRAFLAALPPAQAFRDAESTVMEQTALGLDPALRTALNALPAQDLHLLTLVVFEDLPIADAAAALGITPAAAKTRLYRVRERLRVQLPNPGNAPTANGGSR